MKMVRTRTPSQFENRTTAGRQLGDALTEATIDADIVLAIPRGGLPLGRAVADALDAPLDIVVAKKIGAPNNPEFALGAVASDGTAWLNDDVIDRRNISQDYVERTREIEAANAREKADRYRDEDSLPDLTDETVVIVDDGIATGSTARACIERVRKERPGRIVLAVPVGSPRAVEELETLADNVVCLLEPAGFRAVGQFYGQFGQVSDAEAMAYLD